MIQEINNTDVLISMRQHLGLPSGDTKIDDILIAACVRRLAGSQCPCSVTTLVNSVLESFQYLFNGCEFDMKSKIEEIIEKLIIANDLLELSEVSTNDLGVKGTWIFSAHPSFLVRKNGTILIFGIVPDEISPVSSLSDRLNYEGCRRFIIPKADEDLVQTLKDLGLIKITESAWLKLPKISTSLEFVSSMNRKLMSASACTEIPGLMIMDGNKTNTYYRGRWSEQHDLTGHFVAKRPHLYGGYIWCYVELKEGLLIRFIDIPFKYNGINQRGCDGGWHLQMALDSCVGKPQVYNVKTMENGDLFEFFSPMPQWAERRFIALGDAMEPTNCLFSYLISKNETSTEENFLKENLWLVRKK